MSKTFKLSFLVGLFILGIVQNAKAIQVILTTNGSSGTSDCAARKIHVSTQGGTGRYELTVASMTTGVTVSKSFYDNVPAEFDIPLDPQPTIQAQYKVTAEDKATGDMAAGKITITPALTGEPNVWLPNVITPNGDGYNDTWNILNNNQDPLSRAVPININRYNVKVFDRNGTVKWTEDKTINTGVLSGSMLWDGFGHMNPTPPYGTSTVLPAGAYFYELNVYNCKYTSGKYYNGYIQLIR